MHEVGPREIRRTEIDNVKNLRAIFADARIHRSVGAGADRRHRLEMRAIVLDKFNPLSLLLPQLQVTI